MSGDPFPGWRSEEMQLIQVHRLQCFSFLHCCANLCYLALECLTPNMPAAVPAC